MARRNIQIGPPLASQCCDITVAIARRVRKPRMTVPTTVGGQNGLAEGRGLQSNRAMASDDAVDAMN